MSWLCSWQRESILALLFHGGHVKILLHHPVGRKAAIMKLQSDVFRINMESLRIDFFGRYHNRIVRQRRPAVWRLIVGMQWKRPVDLGKLQVERLSLLSW